MFAHIRGRAVAFKVSLQVPAGATILAWLAGAVVHIYREKNHIITDYKQLAGQPLSASLKADHR